MKMQEVLLRQSTFFYFFFVLIVAVSSQPGMIIAYTTITTVFITLCSFPITRIIF